MPWRHFFNTIFFSQTAFIYLPASWDCLIFENFCLERILRDLEAIMEFLDLILRFLALFPPIFSDLCRIHVFQSIVQKIQGFKNGFLTHNFRLFEVCPIFSTQWNHKLRINTQLYVSVNNTMHTLHIIVNQSFNVKTFWLTATRKSWFLQNQANFRT